MCMVFCIMIVTVPMMLGYASHDSLSREPGYMFN